jgi:polyhydroxyalkanoate synthesis regulator phasin
VASAWLLRGEDAGALEARTSAALAQLRAENLRLRDELTAVSQRLDQGLRGVGDRGADELERRVEDAKQSVRMIESRVTAQLDVRLDALEAQLREGGGFAAAPAPAVAPPPGDASAWDVSTILDRLYALEMRQEQDGVARETSERASSARIERLERRLAQIEGPGAAAPAAPLAP